MKEIIIEPHIRIGQLKLGMTSDELENALLQMKKQWSNSSDEAMQMECCAETDDPNLITGRYMDNDSFFLVQYRNGKATEIGIQRDLSKVASIKLFGMDMFNTTAECIIDSLMKKDNVICNEKDLQLGTEYLFPEIGVRLWRERAFHLKLLKDPLYMEEMQAVLEDEYQYGLIIQDLKGVVLEREQLSNGDLLHLLSLLLLSGFFRGENVICPFQRYV